MAPSGPSISPISLPVHNDVSDLLLWKDPVKSGLILSAISVAYVVLEWMSWSLISTLAIVAQFAVVTSFLWAFLANLLSRAGPPVPSILREGVSEGQIKRAAEQCTPLLNKGLALAFRLATGKDFVLTTQAVVALYVISKLGAIFSVVTWLYLVALAAFSVPKLYELKKVEIDGAIKTATDKSKQLYDTHAAPLVAKIPRASRASSTKPVKADLSATAESFRSTVNDAVLENPINDKKAM